MDISSLLSPQDSPARETSSPSAKTAARNQRKAKASSLGYEVGASPLSNANAFPDSHPRNAATYAQTLMPSPATNGSPHVPGMAMTSTPPADGTSSHRQSSTSGMDTLAELASMQHHQQTARVKAGGLRSTEVYDSQINSTPILSSLHTLQRASPGSRGSFDINMTDGSAQTPPPRTFTAASLSEQELRTVAELVTYLADNPFAYESHVQLVKLLHGGLVSHVYPSGSSIAQGDPHTYDLLQDLQQATEDMDARFALGEELWKNRINDQKLLAETLEDCIAVMELCQKSVDEETGSTELWAIFGDWMLTLHDLTNSLGSATNGPNAMLKKSQRWSEEDKIVAKEAFGRQQVLEIWKEAVEETKFRIDDSHLIWDRYTELLLQDLDQSPLEELVSSMKGHFIDRLQTPHANWDQTFQTFSTFISTYANSTYEETMVSAKLQSVDARNIYELREIFEVKLRRARESRDKDVEWSSFADYLEWENAQSRKKKLFNFEVSRTLYERAILRFPTDTSLWEDYFMFVVDHAESQRHRISILSLLERATRHCPWSGTLWSQYLQAAEREHQPFTDVGQIKHKATSTGLLDAGGMEEVLKVLTAWCGFLRRRAFSQDSTDEDLDVAEVGIRSAIEDMENLGLGKYGKEYQGDPQYRLERIYIKYLSQGGSWQSARDTWKSLIARHGDSHEFWVRFYVWEMTAWGKLTHNGDNVSRLAPGEATKVLRQALRRPRLDWPERIIEVFLHHCEDHEDISELQSAFIETKKAAKALIKRREREAQEAARLVQQQQEVYPEIVPETQHGIVNGKRKRDDSEEFEDAGASKKSRADIIESQEATAQGDPVPTAPSLKRDRENATVIVRNLPLDTKESRVRNYFRDCGTINSLKLLPDEDGTTAVATIEFDSREDVLTAQTRDMKTFEGNPIEVQVGTGSTLFVTNFPPTADEAYIREMFGKYGDVVDVRFPSLKYNTHRRFCYVQYKSSSEAQAATELDQRPLEGKLKLVAKISDPAHKQNRIGAVYDGREVYVSNVDWAVTEEEIAEIFSKYGKVERVRVPRNVAGKSKGTAFVVYSNKDEAVAALELNLTKVKSRLMNVSLSTTNPAKRQATTLISSTSHSSKLNSPQPISEELLPQDAASNPAPSASPPPTSTQPPRPTREQIASKTIALLNIPDTINDTRIHALVEPYGSLTKITLRPDHSGAIVEFKDATGAGKASLGLDGHEIAPGRKIRVGTVAEMMKEKAEWRKDRITAMSGPKSADVSKAEFQASGVINRPRQQTGRRGGKGGLGLKNAGVGLSGARATGKGVGEGSSSNDINGETEKSGEGTKAKSNADFKAMFFKSSKGS